MEESEHIKELIQDNELEAAERELKLLIASHPDCDEAHFLLGNVYTKRNDLGAALTAYGKALAINPDSPAHLAHDHIIEIMNFFHHDLYNP